MKLNKLGNSDLLLSQIGLGTWAIGGGDWGMGWGDQDEGESIQAILEALEHGINWIDTAHAYGFGVSEEAVGKALREWKADDIIVATKCGVLPQEDNKPRRFISSSTIREEVEGSLRRLRRDWIDLYQIHWPDPWRIWPNLETLQELERRAKSVGPGSAIAGKRNLSYLINRAGYSNQPMYSMLARDIEPEVLPWCGGKGTGVRLQSYAFRSAYGKASAVAMDCRITTEEAQEGSSVVSPLQSEEGMEAFCLFRMGWVPSLDNGRTIGQLAVAWTLRREEVTSRWAPRRPG